MRTVLFLLAMICVVMGMYSREKPSQVYKANEKVNFKIVGKFPRANNQLFFTEGLSFIDKDTLMESCGLYGDSEIHFIENFDKPESTLSNRHQLSKEYFGEGSDTVQTPDGVEHYMMTYKERKVFVFDDTLENIKREYEMPKVIKEGWGLTHYKNGDKPMLLVSDGTNRIFHVDPSDFSVQKTVEVYDFNRMELDQLNELEHYKDGTILANIWNTNQVARIDPETGDLIDLYSFQGLIDELETESKYRNYVDPFYGSVLNGIAYHHDSDRLIMGGKKWPYWYEVELDQ